MKIIKQIPLLILALLAISFMAGCEDDDSLPVENELTLNLSSADMIVGNQLTLMPRYGSVQLPQKDYEWVVSDTTVITVEMDNDSNNGIITAVGEGSATATIRSLDGSLEASCLIDAELIRETMATLPDMMTAYTQAEVTVSPDFNNVEFPVRSYTWSASPDGIIEITDVDEDTKEATIQGLQVGTTTLTLTSEDGVVTASTEVTVEDENDGIIKILAIGNSFSEDALETYLFPLADAADKDIVIGNMYIGGAELALHADNAVNDNDAYSYRKIDMSGNMTTSSNVSISTAIDDENWDYISFQQASPKSGQYETFVDPLPTLYEEVSDEVENEFTKYVLHRTWAYAQNSTHPGFPNYGSDQMTMFNAIVDAYNQADDLIPTNMIIPAGTGIQNGRTSYLGDGFTRDGYHLNELGKFVAAAVWYEKLFGESVLDNPYEPAGFVPFNIELAKNAAHEAVLSPNSVTELTDYEDAGGSGVLTSDVFIDFSTISSSDGWNGMTSFLADSSIPNLLYPDNTFTGITATITERFNGQNTGGTSTSNTEFNMPADVSSRSFFGNPGGTWAGLDIDKSVVTFSGFTSTDTYEFCFFSSRMNVGDNRETQFTVSGANSEVGLLDAANNETEIVCLTGIQPDANGEISVEVTSGPNNSNGFEFYYLSAMRVSPE